MNAPPGRALQLKADSALHSRFANLVGFYLDGSATFGSAVRRS
jgi:hypothetical protein